MSSSNSDHSFHFLLIHGGGHGAWCWYKVVSLLKQAGHRVDAVDLTSAGINNHDASAVFTLEKFVEPLKNLLQALPSGDKVVLVGHSLGGLGVTYALENYSSKVVAGVYLAAMMLPSGASATALYSQIITAVQNYINVQYADEFTTPLTVSFKLNMAEECLYQKCPREDIELAKSLLKPFPVFDPAVTYTNERYGSVPRYFIKTMDDQSFAPEHQEALIQMTPPKRVLSIDSDHSPFFSEPTTLVSYLVQIAAEESRQYHLSPRII